jgi:hypothetical protein
MIKFNLQIGQGTILTTITNTKVDQFHGRIYFYLVS